MKRLAPAVRRFLRATTGATRRVFSHHAPRVGRVAVTAVVVIGAAFAGLRLWNHYEIDPWTRDGRVKASVVQIAPDVTGPVVEVAVHDNESVHAGQVLFRIDPTRFELALRQAQSAESQQRAVLAQAERESRRNNELRDLVSAEVREQGLARVEQARAALMQAVVNRDTAALNLQRTRVLSPVDGTVTNLDLRTGAYAAAGKAVLALVDRHSFYVEGYFEETKLPHIHLGDKVSVLLMGERHDVQGHVDSIASGIADRDRTTGNDLLPNVNPTFNWVRLAQRVPVRVSLDDIPASVRLVAGQTATVTVVN
ncbi:efflux RND transporter periplasmic adaptor subunit [Pigmentiphaga litoralis]|uniref:Multidrug resistance efflux pump n=1 Tax=Pigmentiphaga litoralis TaxID=516702 RepID=A0A7Y9IVL6_9BURK|nr:HlyD family secretion protein [Pigmentiphaga litoralis]NYE22607.1 multidrug resistance efflux pump [Pigmentiphaga litoralis]NYE83778.1 multidrug resistance efflux pump [Pigmentiphaga litoralis]